MLFVLSPAKTLDYERPLPRGVRQRATEPVFLAQAADLMARLKAMDVDDVAGLMGLSEALAALNAARYAAWEVQHDDRNSRPAVLAFNGDVYDGLDARSLRGPDLGWAQEHLAILSGLYGVLRPLDRIQAYRLEMGTRLTSDRGRDLYEYWGERVADHLAARLASHRTAVLVNLASQEYFRVAQSLAGRCRVVECVFEDWKTDQYKLISFFAKRARGAMARWAIAHRVRSVKALAGFDADGYSFAPGASSADRLVFRRRQTD